MTLRAAAVVLLALSAAVAQAASMRLCDGGDKLSADQQDRLLRVAAIVQHTLDASGASLAVVARSGLDLSRFGLRYSHAGVSVRTHEHGPWTVRQLYFACDEGRPRLYDQGLAGFLFGTDDPQRGSVSILLPPAGPAGELETALQDRRRALRLVAARYSANAYAWSLRYQNCNQWLIELMAVAWGGLADGPELRARAQRWLADQDYRPWPVPVGSHLLMIAGSFVPWLRYDDHPEEDRYALQFRTTVPASIEAFLRQRLPATRRIEICHDAARVVVREGWRPIADGCRPEPGDRVVRLD